MSRVIVVGGGVVGTACGMALQEAGELGGGAAEAGMGHFAMMADGTLRNEEVWRQESIIGRAWVSGEGTLLLDESDPFRWGIGA
jgi:proline racemase